MNAVASRAVDSRACAATVPPAQSPAGPDAYALLAHPPSTRSGGLRLGQTIPSALQALRANLVRSLLTALGIIIGVAAVISVVALGQGASAAVSAQLQSLGTDQLTIQPGSTRTGGVFGGAGSVSTLKSADAVALQQSVAGIKAISAVAQTNAQVIVGNTNWQTRVNGVSPAYQQVQAWNMAAGTFFTEHDNEQAANVAVIGQTVAANLFPDGRDPLGQTMQVRNVPFTVVGVLVKKGTAGPMDQDDVVLVPLNTAQVRLLGSKTVNNIVVQAADASKMTELQNAITAELRVLHKLGTGQANDFFIRNNADLIERATGVTETLTYLLAAVAIVSLIVGGIGIMNIMLVSVTERTREIGIRAAIGARSSDILAQFLVEALVISVAGGLLGVALGAAVALLMPVVAGWATVLSWEAIALAFGFSAGVGIFFGLYPARKAAWLDPIEALRYQ
jgi:putative ABC transport system permease protein